MNAFIVCPSCAHGITPVRRSSVYFKSLIGDAFQKKKAVYVGEGTNVTGMVSWAGGHSRQSILCANLMRSVSLM